MGQEATGPRKTPTRYEEKKNPSLEILEI